MIHISERNEHFVCDETVMRKHVQNMSKVVCGAIIAFKVLIHLTLYVLLLI